MPCHAMPWQPPVDALLERLLAASIQPVCFVAHNSQTQALVHVSDLDVSRVSDPADLFQVGDRVDLKRSGEEAEGRLRLLSR